MTKYGDIAIPFWLVIAHVSHLHLVFLPGDETIKAVFTFLTVICLVQCFVDYI